MWTTATRLAALLVLVASGAQALRSSLLPYTTRTVVVSDFVDCKGDTDDTANFATALTAAAGGALVVPSQCIIRFASPGNGNAAATIPSNTAILCEDQTAGFTVVRQRCVGGTYGETAPCNGASCIGAACTSSPQCLGGGTCSFDFGAATFAPTGGSTYTIFKDSGTAAQDITIENCSFWTAQADPYQRCVGTGGNNGDPCRQECDNASASPGMRCDDAAVTQCTGGTCLRLADCGTGGGTGSCNGHPCCNGAPGVPSGAGKINPIDFRNTFNPRFVNVNIYDHFTGDFGINTGNYTTMRDTNVAREITDCSSPFATPTSSSCLSAGTVGKTCCYGAAFGTSFTTNTQPTTAVTNGVVVGKNSQLIRTTGRGVTTAITGDDATRIDESTAWPDNAAFGPGTRGNGFKVGANAQIAKSQALALVSGGTGVLLNGANGAAIRNNIIGITGAGVGVSANSDYPYISGNYLEGDAATGAGVVITAGNNAVVQGNQIKSNAVDLLDVGIKLTGTPSYVLITDNQIDRVKTATVDLTGAAFSIGITANRSTLSGARPTSALQPVHVLSDGGATNVRVTGNTFAFGFRGISQGRDNVSFNFQIIGNRFQGLSGAAIVFGQSGINVVGNYVNRGFTGSGEPTLTCDATCRGGSPLTAGQLCQQDTDCTAGGNTCNASVKKCIPEAAMGYIGNPMQTTPVGAGHNQWLDNLLFITAGADLGVGATSLKQCTAGTNPGALCTVDTCASSETCTGGPPAICNGTPGADHGKRCCAGGGGCAVRTALPWLRFVDPGSAVTHQQGTISTNTIFGSPTITDVVGLDLVSSFDALTNMTVSQWQVAGNIFSAPSGTNTTAIKFPTNTTEIAKITNFQVGDQAFLGGWANTLQNYQWSFGSYLPQNGTILVGSGRNLSLTSGTSQFFPFNGSADANATETNIDSFASLPMTVWKMTCQVNSAPGGTSKRTFTLDDNAGATTMTCDITGTATACNTAAGTASAPVAITVAHKLSYKEVVSVANAAAAASGSCYALVTYGNTF